MNVQIAITHAASRITGAAVDLIFPKQCYVCRKHGYFVCSTCEPDLPPLLYPYCSICAQPESRMTRYCRRCQEHPLDIDGIRSPYVLDGPVRTMVHAFKYQGIRALAQPLGELMARYYQQEEEELAADMLVPVPLHPRKERERGYNQSALLARAMGAILGLLWEPRALRRVRSTPSQARSVSSEERRINVHRAFAADRPLVEGKAVLLIDDVCTTGATLEACAIALKDAGALSVWGLTLAREA